MSYREKIKAIIFDFDNTLLNSRIIWWEIGKEVEKKLNIKLGTEVGEILNWWRYGPFGFSLLITKKLEGKEDLEKAKEFHKETTKPLMLRLYPTMPLRAPKLLKELQEEKRLCIVSMNHYDVIEKTTNAWKERYGVNFFPIVGQKNNCSYTIKEAKGEKEIRERIEKIKKILKELSNFSNPIFPEQVMYLGDRPDDMKASKEVGCISIALINLNGKYSIEDYVSDYKITKLSGLKEVIEKIEQSD